MRLLAGNVLVSAPLALLTSCLAVAPLFSAPSADLLLDALRLELRRVPGDERREAVGRVRSEANAVTSSIGASVTPAARFTALNHHFFSPHGYAAVSDLAAPENTSLAAVLSNRRGTCVGLAIVYVSLARQVGLDAHAVATPVHVFVRVGIDGKPRNVELTEGGREVDDDTYRRRYRIDDASIATGAFMQPLSDDELIAHLLSNQAVALSKAGDVKSALKRYDKALGMHPKLVAAWYNRGIDLMNVGKLQKALESFDHALELYPSDAQARNNRGLAFLKLGNLHAARVDFTRALELDPALSEAEENLRQLETRLGTNR